MLLRELSITDITRRLEGRGLHLRTGPFTLEIRSHLPAISRGLCLLYGDFPISDGETSGYTDFHVRFDRPRFVRRFVNPQVWFYFDGKTPFKPLPVEQALPMFEWCLNWCVANHAHQYLIIHAAVIERGGRAVVLPAPPGSGKSTLTAALIHHGWRLLSDELCLVQRGGDDAGRLIPLPRPVSLKNESIAIVRGLYPQSTMGPACSDTVKGTVAHLKPPTESVLRVHESASPAWIIFPKWNAGAPAALTSASKPTTFIRLADHAFNYSLLGVEGFESMRGLIERSECFDFTYSRIDDALRLFDELAGTVTATAGDARVSQAAPNDVISIHTAPASSHTHLLAEVLRESARLRGLSLESWDVLIRQARHALLLARLAGVVERDGLHTFVPEPCRPVLLAARLHAEKHHRTSRWEINRICRALRDVDAPIVLLKGAAYVAANLPPAMGRVVSDTDILVPKERLQDVETALLSHGYEATKLDAYDQRYYREWMHELPPLRHRTRQTVVDVHHNILPLTDRAHPEARRLIENSVALDDSGKLRILSPVDMVLHSAVHLFHDGEFEHGLRDLVDLDSLLRHFALDERFVPQLQRRARELGLHRSIAYAMRYTKHFLATPIGDEVLDSTALPGPAALRLVDAMFHRALRPDHPTASDGWTPVARTSAFVRGHVLRMPPHVLAPHLIRKALRRHEVN